MQKYRDVIEMHPTYGLGHHGLAVALWNHKQPQQALLHIKRAIKLNPNDVEQYYIAGRICFSLGEMAIAMKYFAVYVEKAPDTYNTADLLKRWPTLASVTAI